MLIALAIHSTRIAIAASPAPRNTALIRNSIRMTPLKPKRIAVNEECASTSGVAPISARIGRANEKPSRPSGTATSRPSAIACTAARAAPSGSLLAHAAGDGGGRAHAEPHRHGVDERHHRLGQADRGDRVGAEARDEEDVDDREHRLEHELEDHRDREQHDRAIDRALGVRAVMRARRAIRGSSSRGSLRRRATVDFESRAGSTRGHKGHEGHTDSRTRSSVSFVSFVSNQRRKRSTAGRRSRRSPRAAPRRAGRRPARSCARGDGRRTCARRRRSSS